MKKIIAIIVVALLATLGLAGPASAGNSFTVTDTGIQLPEGKTFGHHNVIHISWVTSNGQEQTARMETGVEGDDPNVKPGAYYADKGFFAFSSLIKSWEDCPQITWVSVNGYDQYRATPDPDKCAAPPADEDDDSNNEADSDNEGDKSSEGDKTTEGDKSSEGDKASEGDKTSEGDKASEGDKTDDGSKDGGDHDSKDIDDSNTDSQKDADGGKDGGEIPPTGISGMVLSLMLGGGLVIVGALTIANSRSKKSARH